MGESLAVWIDLPEFVDSRGRLTALEFLDLPFTPRRVFYVQDVPRGTTRGGHAHRETKQLLISVSGRIDIELARGELREMTTCEPNGRGLLVEPGIHTRQKYIDDDAKLIVLCSHPYDPDSYVSTSNIERQ